MLYADTQRPAHQIFNRDDQRKVVMAVGASLLLHLLFVFGFTLVKWSVPLPVPQSDESLEVMLVPSQDETMDIMRLQMPTPAPRTRKSYVDSDGLQKSEKAPTDAVFESDENMSAASELPAAGDAPLPTQRGKERPFAQFENRNYSPKTADESAEAVPEQLKATAQPAPLQQPTPIQAAQTTPAPVRPTPAMTAKSDATPSQDSLPLPETRPTPSETLAMLKQQPAPRTQSKPAAKSGYQPQRERTMIEGSISNRGKAAVSAIGTPLGRYRKLIADAIGSRWYYYVNQRMDLISIGSVHIKFFINEAGRVEELKVLSNSSNETFANYSVQSILEAKMPPLPEDTVPLLDNGRLEVEYTFTIYPN
jgi:outer membrane biosynthesis protein TonB